jgi:hypothetical protein
MRANLRGTTREIRKYAEKLRAVGSDRVLRKLCDNVAVEGLDLIEEGFEAQKNPEGGDWPKKVFEDGRQVLVGNTTRLRRGWHRKWISATGFCLSPSVAYAIYQKGTGIYGPTGEPIRSKSGGPLVFKAARRITPKARKGASPILSVGKRGSSRWGTQTVVAMSVKGSPPRLMVPNTRKLPPKWERRFRAAAHDFLRHYFGGA